MEISEAIKELRNIPTSATTSDTHRKRETVFDMAVAALEKQMPKKPAMTCKNEVIHCPNCDYDLMGGVEIDAEDDPEYCWKCGQKLDWVK